MKLIDDWRLLAPKLWSIRLSLIAALASAVEAGFDYYMNDKPPILSIVAVFVSFGAAFARLIAQPQAHADVCEQ